ncbi:alanine/glycine:cation symporter family protein [Megasphaera sp. WILCCON 0056]|uniref:alanine/glycine:cation symporter family protein n=1 Tax=Megasphaera sp. WILCCON 0056 TaxID=3345340 RepID=UPI003A80D0C3
MMANLESVAAYIAALIWSDWLLFALLGLGGLCTIMTGCIQLRCLFLIPKGVLKYSRRFSKEQKGCSSWQSLCASLASCVGSGNIVGVSTAILAGGDGALFWMWFAAFFGMATAFSEIVMGVKYHGYDKDGNITGGSMYYIANGLGWKKVGMAVAVFLFIQNCGGTLIQSNTISQIMIEAFHVPTWITAVLLGFLMSFIVSGGFQRLVNVAQKVVPFMAGTYLLVGFIVMLIHIEAVPGMFLHIVQDAFSLQAGSGAALGYTAKEAMRYGISRGLYSNEAGEGTAPVLHAAAQVDHPVRQGFYGVIEVFVDTFLICSTTGIVILLTDSARLNSNAVTLTAVAFDSIMPGMRYFMYFSLILFAGTSIMNQWYFGHVSLTFLQKEEWDGIYRYIFPILIAIGCIGTIRLVWSIQDIALGLLIIPNILGLAVLSIKVRKLTKEFLNPKNKYI